MWPIWFVHHFVEFSGSVNCIQSQCGQIQIVKLTQHWFQVPAPISPMFLRLWYHDTIISLPIQYKVWWKLYKLCFWVYILMNVENLMPNTIVDRKYLGFASDIKQCERHNIYLSRFHGKNSTTSFLLYLFSNYSPQCASLKSGIICSTNIAKCLRVQRVITTETNWIQLLHFILMNHNKSLEVFLST